MREEPGGRCTPPDLGQPLLLFWGVSQLGKAFVGALGVIRSTQTQKLES